MGTDRASGKNRASLANRKQDFLLERIDQKKEVAQLKGELGPFIDETQRMIKACAWLMREGRPTTIIQKKIDANFRKLRKYIHQRMIAQEAATGRNLMGLIESLERYHEKHLALEEARKLKIELEHKGSVERVVRVYLPEELPGEDRGVAAPSRSTD